MSLGSDIYDRAKAATAFNTLIGGSTAPRIYPTTAPQGATVPYVIWQQITATPAETHSDATLVRHNLVQFACFAETFEEADALREALITAYDNVELTGGDSPTLQDVRDGYEDAVSLYRCDADFLI